MIEVKEEYGIMDRNLIDSEYTSGVISISKGYDPKYRNDVVVFQISEGGDYNGPTVSSIVLGMDDVEKLKDKLSAWINGYSGKINY